MKKAGVALVKAITSSIDRAPRALWLVKNRYFMHKKAKEED